MKVCKKIIMIKLLNFLSAILLILFLVFVSCSGNSKELREKAVADSIACVQAIADSLKKIEEQFPTSLVIQGTNVNLRVDAKLDAVKIKQLKTGDTCEVLEKGRKQTIDDKTDYWYKIKFKNKEGWIFGAFTSIKLPPEPEEKPKTGIISQKKNKE
jgi:hypothetical protein